MSNGKKISEELFGTEFLSKLKSFIDSMASDDYSYFRYSLSGDKYGRNDSWGLGNLVFAAKILYISGLMDTTETRRKQNMADSILEFASANGYINDPIVTGFNIKRGINIIIGR